LRRPAHYKTVDWPVGARITAEAGVSWNLYLDYQGLFANRLQDNALTLGFVKHF
jgi:hypothetical protein